VSSSGRRAEAKAKARRRLSAAGVNGISLIQVRGAARPKSWLGAAPLGRLGVVAAPGSRTG
jgi:hypothetical protein